MRSSNIVEKEIANLGGLLRSELSERWEAIYGVPPPKGARRVLLERAIAWHIQAKVFGGLKKETSRVLLHAPAGRLRTGPKRISPSAERE